MTKSPTTLNLLVIRSLEPKRTVAFYELLGIAFQEEQHGKGPIHWAAELEGVVLEVYPAKSAEEVGQTSRLGFKVEAISEVVIGIVEAEGTIVSEPKQSPWGLRAVVRDPDNRTVELVQRD